MTLRWSATRGACALGLLLPGLLAAAPYTIDLDARAHGQPLAPCAAGCTAMMQAVTQRLGDAPEGNTALLRVQVGAPEHRPAPPGIGFQLGNPHPDLGAGGSVPQTTIRCEVTGPAPGAYETRLALPEPTALERLAGRGMAVEAVRFGPVIADACARALRVAGLHPPQADFRSAVVIVTPADEAKTAPAAATGTTLRRANSTAEALKGAVPGDVIFEFGQPR